MINLDYKDPRPIYEQIEQGLRQRIVSGVLKADTQIPSVRELSVQLTVNPNTVQRAYKTLEASGFIYSIKGKGNFVAKVDDSMTNPRKAELQETVLKATKELKFLGVGMDTILETIREAYEEKEDASK